MRKLPLTPAGFCDIGFGCTSSYRMIQLLQYSLSIPEWNHKNETAMEWMVTKFIPSIKRLFKEEGFASVKENQESGGDFLVTFQSYLFEVNGDYQVIDYENQEYATCGCGEQFAYGSLFANRDRTSVSAEFKCRDAIRAAMEFSAYCNGDVHTIYVK